MIILLSALFNFQSMMIVVSLFICTAAYVNSLYPSLLGGDLPKKNWSSIWKAARIGQRASPFVSGLCLGMAVWIFIS